MWVIATWILDNNQNSVKWNSNILLKMMNILQWKLHMMQTCFLTNIGE